MSLPALGEVLAKIAGSPEVNTWPVLVSLSPDAELTLGGEGGEVTSVPTGNPIAASEQFARQFDSHPCVVCTASRSAKRLMIGRSRLNDYVIGHVSVSASHAEFRVVPGGDLQLVDGKSRNGTFVERRRLDQGESVIVSSNSLVAFGDVAFYLLDTDMLRTLARVAHPRKQ